MDQKELLEIVERIDQSSLAYLSFKQDGTELILAKEVPQLTSHSDNNVEPYHTEEPSLIHNTNGEKEIFDVEVQSSNEQAVTSPIVGIVYFQAKPGEPAFIKVGDQVEAGQTICIVEAMKMMNEIPAPISGQVVEICVENEEVVEYQQVLVRIQA
ncbi:acetyl-CoA carboxylase biotin carboxyl carrier protein [Facklamia sp. DSM 111018]|uniref:Biotin carboxyl carrier protein of acetyl-CoA carboxylase n=1 Tax=Facklamia lactis TaxID=2749967 RepID=A0ABS0LSN6_9LACT|nr:acetyl-CoA carboxylase biotin carboxyl carrier protein [Facklamia lactis]MBG9981346.1 acetyl-CoA carboxylase biotin carboxyl carrier protein [Facklamia lactis]MBG9987178.1 acetyl-CoA carboxylase biotin carboxyl carrier protein [Facklamia lactis]